MEEKDKKKHKHSKEHKESRKHKRRRRSPSTSSSSSSGSDEWVEKSTSQKQAPPDREDWMSMTGMLKTYTKDDIKPKREEKEKKNIDSYNPATSTRELNPYWKDGGTGVPQTPEEFRKSKPFIKPTDDDDYYSRSSSSKERSRAFIKPSDDDNYYSRSSTSKERSRAFIKPSDDDDYYSRSSSSKERNRAFIKPSDDDDYYSRSSRSKERNRAFIKPSDDDDYYSRSSSSKDRKKSFMTPTDDNDDYYSRSSSRSSSGKDRERDDHRESYRKGDSYSYKSNWKKSECTEQKHQSVEEEAIPLAPDPVVERKPEKQKENKYLSDEKMNKLAAKIVKAEIMGDNKLVEELKEKLEAAREYRKQNPDAAEEDDGVMLMSTNIAGNSRPLTKGEKGDPRSKGGKRKTETHASGERMKYFGDDDKYNLAQMFQQEKYGNNYDDDAQLAKLSAKHKNPNDDLEDIFVDEISKSRNEAKDSETEKQRAINQHVKMEKTLDGCEYCVGSKHMLKHLMVSCGSKVYLALPARKSLVKGHCILTTIQHSMCVTSLDEDVWEEIMNYRKALTQFFNSQNKDVVFYETAIKFNRFPHIVINCVPMPRDVGDMAAIYFKKALLECEAEWSMNKKVVDLKGKNIRRGVPKGLPYFWIDFGMEPGFAHVIEDQQLFPRTFAEEIIAGILDLEHRSWKNPQKEYGDLQRKKVLEFIKEWKPFDIAEANKI